MYLLDTNICVYVLNNSYPNLTDKVFSYSRSEIAISSITVFELEYGAAKSNWGEKTRKKLQMFLSPFQILDFDDKDALIAGEIRAYLEKSGLIIGPYDIQIAAQGLARDITVVTHNTREFLRVPNLKLEDWVL